MICPVCKDTNLVMAERQGVEIDYCPKCRGVWLDRGELDKIIEKSISQDAPRVAAPPMQQTAPIPEYRPQGHDDYKHYDKHDYHGYHKKKSFLHELFD